MRYSRWAQQNKHKLGMYDGENRNRKEVDMSNKSTMNSEERNRVIRALEDVAARNNNKPTRADAVALLAGKQAQPKQLRPGVRELLNGGGR